MFLYLSQFFAYYNFTLATVLLHILNQDICIHFKLLPKNSTFYPVNLKFQTFHIPGAHRGHGFRAISQKEVF